MSSIPPALPPTTPIGALLAQAANTVTVVGATADLLTLLAANPIVEVTATQPQPGTPGLLQVQTPAGPLLLKLSMPVPDGATLRLQVINLGTAQPPLLRVIAVNGLPVSPSGQIGGTLASAVPAMVDANRQPPSATTSAARSPAEGPPGAPPGFLATVVRTAGSSPGTAPLGRWALPAGTTFTVRIASLQMPDPLSAPATSATSAGGEPATPSRFAGPADDRAMASDLRTTVMQAVKAYTPGGAAAPMPPDPARPAGNGSGGPEPQAGPGPPATAPPTPARETASGPPSPAPADTGGSEPSPAAPAAPERPFSASPTGLPPDSPRPAASPPLPQSPPALTPETAAPSLQIPSEVPGDTPPGPPPGTLAGSSPGAPPGTTPAPSLFESPLLDLGADGATGFEGVVAQNSYAGRPLIQTPLGLLTLDPGPDLPPGAKVGLTLVTQPAAPPPAAATVQTVGMGQTSAMGQGPTWPALNDLMQTLHRLDPEAAQMLAQRLPDAGPRLAPAMVAIAAAVQSGSAAPMLGNRTVKALERAGRRDLVETLEKDLGGLTTPVRLPLAGQWQSILLPLPFGPQIHPIRLIVRKPPEDEEETEARDNEGSRFLLDVDMSRLGPLQLDGLVKRRAKRFDLVVRSHLPLPTDVRRDIGSIFFRALEGLGMTGEANFQQVANFIEPIPADLPQAPGLMI